MTSSKEKNETGIQRLSLGPDPYSSKSRHPVKRSIAAKFHLNQKGRSSILSSFYFISRVIFHRHCHCHRHRNCRPHCYFHCHRYRCRHLYVHCCRCHCHKYCCHSRHCHYHFHSHFCRRRHFRGHLHCCPFYFPLFLGYPTYSCQPPPTPPHPSWIKTTFSFFFFLECGPYWPATAASILSSIETAVIDNCGPGQSTKKKLLFVLVIYNLPYLFNLLYKSTV